jgi:alpha-glucosidase
MSLRTHSLPLVAVGLALFAAALLSACARGERAWGVVSPDGQLALNVTLDEGGRLHYTVERGPESARRVVIEKSPLGLVRQDEAFVEGLAHLATSELETLDETYAMPHGKRRERRHHARQRVVTFANAGGGKLALVLRAANDGVAFRYRFPETGETPVTLVEEATAFKVPAGSRAWIIPHQTPDKWGPAYEDFYVEGDAGATSPRPSGWFLPGLFKVADRLFVLVTEAAVDRTSCGSRLAAEAPDGLYRFSLPEPAEGLGQGAVSPSSSRPWTLPWRVFLVGEPATLVESTLVEDLNPATAIEDTSWIRPGRASWSWWSDNDSPKDATKLRTFVDLAAEMGWEYTLIDANWDLMQNGTVEDVVAYAKEKGVGALLWYNSGGPHNEVTERPRDRMFDPEVRRAELRRLAEWGVKGIKVDFWHSDKQEHMKLYLDLLKDAAEQRILVNFHGCTLPRGWSRTYPHLVTMEAVMGAEQYLFQPAFAEKGAWHNTVLPFTRNAVGPMDYTPVAFTETRFPHQTSDAHELALSVVFESGIVHMADSVSAYRDLPEAPQAFLAGVPAAWDETRLLAGEPGDLVVIARRNGTRWYVGGISARKEPRTERVDLGRLGPGRWTADLIADGETSRSFAASSKTLESGQALEVAMLAQGGFVAQLTPLAQP